MARTLKGFACVAVSAVLAAIAMPTLAASGPPEGQGETKNDPAPQQEAAAGKTDRDGTAQDAVEYAPGEVPRPRGKVALPTKVDPKTGKPVVVITNADLERMFGRSIVPRSSAVVPSAAPGPQGGATGTPGGASPAGTAPPPPPARSAAEIEAEIQRLQGNVSKMRNPFLGSPKLTDEEREQMAGKGNAQRVEMTQAEISALEQELAKSKEHSDSSSPDQ